MFVDFQCCERFNATKPFVLIALESVIICGFIVVLVCLHSALPALLIKPKSHVSLVLIAIRIRFLTLFYYF